MRANAFWDFTLASGRHEVTWIQEGAEEILEVELTEHGDGLGGSAEKWGWVKNDF